MLRRFAGPRDYLGFALGGLRAAPVKAAVAVQPLLTMSNFLAVSSLAVDFD